MRLNLMHPEERRPLSWDFGPELAGKAVRDIKITAEVDPSSKVSDSEAPSMLDSEPWMEDGTVFQLVRARTHGVDYRVTAKVTREDGEVYIKVSILPVRDA